MYKTCKSASMQREVLEKRRIFGEEHPNTISTMNNLANRLRNLGKLEEVALVQREVLEKRSILGEEHPNNILAINNLANTLGHQKLHNVLFLQCTMDLFFGQHSSNFQCLLACTSGPHNVLGHRMTPRQADQP